MKLHCLSPRLAPAVVQGWKPDSVRGTRQQRGYGSEWDSLRRSILARDKGLCQPCFTQGHITPATQVDHRVPKAQGGSDDQVNLQSICEQCHRTKTASESRKGGG